MQRYGPLRDRLRTNRFRDFGEEGINNARLLSVGLYHRNFGLFEQVYRRQGQDLKMFLRVFTRLAAEEDGDLLQAARRRLDEKEANSSPGDVSAPGGEFTAWR